ncbi:hypothetical protein HID58_062043, partial [Brassica napus]
PLTLVSPSIYLSWRTNVWLSPVNRRYPTTTTHLRFSCPEVIVGINITKITPHIIHCTTGNAFDHTLLISGCTPIFIVHTCNSPATSNTGVHHHNYPNGHQPTHPHVHPTRRHPTHPNLPCYPSSVRD